MKIYIILVEETFYFSSILSNNVPCFSINLIYSLFFNNPYTVEFNIVDKQMYTVPYNQSLRHTL